MTVPRFYEFMLPVLQQLADGEAKHWRELRDGCIAAFKLSDEDVAEEMSSGASRVDNRVLWSNTYLYQAALVDRPRRGRVQINDRGRQVLADPPDVITPDYLLQFPEFRQFQSRGRQRQSDGTTSATPAPTEQGTPLESISGAVQEATAALQDELLKRVRSQPPEFLEQLVLRLLDAMGYGGQAGAIEHRGRPRDGGIDGVIRQDPLGVDRVYLQAKRYTDTAVGRPDMQAFVGALHGEQADRGVFITTSRFSADAEEYVGHIPNRIILIDGERLAELMVLYDVGVQVDQTFTLKRIDEDFFE